MKGILEVGGGARCTAKIPLRKVTPHAHIGTYNELATHSEMCVPFTHMQLIGSRTLLLERDKAVKKKG